MTDFGRRPNIPIKSIQSGTITIPHGSISNTATINAIDTDKALLLFLGIRPAATTASFSQARLELTNSTTITAIRNGTTTPLPVNFMIIEFISGIKSNQRATISIDGVLSNTATINAIDTDKALLSHLSQSCDQSDLANCCPTLTLTDQTTVTAEKYNAGGKAIVSFQVLEFI